MPSGEIGKEFGNLWSELGECTNSNFGLVTVISVFFALIGAIIVMPAILVLAGRFEKDPDPS